MLVPGEDLLDIIKKIQCHTVIDQHNLIDSLSDHSIMCMVILSVLGKCHHELATIDYCPSTEPSRADDEEDPKPEEESTPRKACTDSLGWQIYTSLDVSCKRENGR
jgi:hypothetical protein